MKTLNKLFALTACVLLLAVNSYGGLQIQYDGSTNASLVAGTVLAGGSSNTYSLYGDITGNYTNGTAFSIVSGIQYTTNGVFIPATQVGSVAFIDCSKSSQAAFAVGGFFTNLSLGSSNILYNIYESMDTRVWQSAFSVSVAVAAHTTNWCYTIFSPETNGTVPYPYYSLQSVYNTNGTIGIPQTWSTGTTNASGATNYIAGNLFFKGFTKTGF